MLSRSQVPWPGIQPMPPSVEAGSPNSWFPIYTDIERNKYRRKWGLWMWVHSCTYTHTHTYIHIHTCILHKYSIYIFYSSVHLRRLIPKRMSIHCTQILVSKCSSLKGIRTPWRNSRCPGLGWGKYKMHLEHFFWCQKIRKCSKDYGTSKGYRHQLEGTPTSQIRDSLNTKITNDKNWL